ncbi:MAG: nicotinate-nicotinamide nucleotide adenylyltransferase [Oligoflexales bacterium]|nr:nicotinate-nicotinamide nucleotide adenylyltransferase [Oligoflexales bacterium]
MFEASETLKFLNYYNPELVIYGGTFDPPHFGHLECVDCAANRFPRAKFIVAPTPKPPQIAGIEKLPFLSFEFRVQLLKKIFARRNSTNTIEFSSAETELPPPNYTVNLLSEFHRRYDGKKLGFLMGQDQIMVFNQWFNPQKIFDLASLVVVQRYKQKENQKEFRQVLVTTFEKINMKIVWVDDSSALIYDGSDSVKPKSAIFMIEKIVCEASSTEIKQFLEDKKAIPKDWLSADLVEMIQDYTHKVRVG